MLFLNGEHKKYIVSLRLWRNSYNLFQAPRRFVVGLFMLPNGFKRRWFNPGGQQTRQNKKEVQL
jgi:hypothetical protein